MGTALPFFLLGLLLTIGYLLWRVGPGRHGRKGNALPPEVYLAKAEREAREEAAKKRGVLELDPGEEKKREQLLKMAEQNQVSECQTGGEREKSPEPTIQGEESDR
ncbi:MAG: hypothetical protein JJU11_11350 [Candidatus Sumerlaeia bacterium]|nr:hypothetical protein [Candidatus Sumerlaeia bacterium]